MDTSISRMMEDLQGLSHRVSRSEELTSDQRRVVGNSIAQLISRLNYIDMTREE